MRLPSFVTVFPLATILSTVLVGLSCQPPSVTLAIVTTAACAVSGITARHRHTTAHNEVNIRLNISSIRSFAHEPSACHCCLMTLLTCLTSCDYKQPCRSGSRSYLPLLPQSGTVLA